MLFNCHQPRRAEFALICRVGIAALLNRMSSSDEEVVRRPGRSGRVQSPAGSELSEPPAAENMDVDEPNDDDNDADLFGSDGSEGGLGNDEYAIALLPTNTTLTGLFSTANLSGTSTTSNSIPAMMRAVMIGRTIAWTMRTLGQETMGRPSTSWI